LAVRFFIERYFKLFFIELIRHYFIIRFYILS